jgi:hypothetical protein
MILLPMSGVLGLIGTSVIRIEYSVQSGRLEID